MKAVKSGSFACSPDLLSDDTGPVGQILSMPWIVGPERPALARWRNEEIESNFLKQWALLTPDFLAPNSLRASHALLLASSYFHVPFMNALLDHGVAVQAVTSEGQTVLHGVKMAQKNPDIRRDQGVAPWGRLWFPLALRLAEAGVNPLQKNSAGLHVVEMLSSDYLTEEAEQLLARYEAGVLHRALPSSRAGLSSRARL